jgi:uncharacterized membrane protein
MLKKNHLAEESKHHSWYFLVTLFLGFWLLFTVDMLGISQYEIVLSDRICGLVAIIASFFALRGGFLSPWVIAFTGVYLQLAPMLFWAKDSSAYLNDTVSGILLILFSLIFPGIKGVMDEDKGQIPKGWSYNPSSWVQRFPILVFGTIGWFAARLMCAYQLGYIDSIWDPFFVDGTEKVISSDISKAFPLPDAGLGALAYSLEVLLGLKGGTARWRTMPWLVVGFSFLVVPLGLVSIVLVILQPLIVGAWCSLCLLAAFCMLLMCMLTLDEVVAVTQLLITAYKEGHLVRTFFKGTYPKGVSDDLAAKKFPPSLKEFLVEMVRGVTFQPYLIGCTFLGFFFMLSPFLFQFEGLMSDFAHTLGALVVVVSILSMAEVARKIRKLNFVLALVLAVCVFFSGLDLITMGLMILASIALAVLSGPKGKLQESYGRDKV